jgi:hypothetical protein
VANSPFRSVAWRWELAGELISEKRRVHCADPEIAEAVAFRKAVLNNAKRPRTITPDRWAVLCEAHELLARSDRRKVLLEARILANCPTANIAADSGLTTEVLAAYCQLFFDVTGRLASGYYVMKHAIGGGEVGESRSQAMDRLIKTTGYLLGPLVLDIVATAANEPNVGVDGILTLKLSTADGRQKALAHLLIAVHCLPVDDTLRLEIQRLADLIAEIEANSRACDSLNSSLSKIEDALTVPLSGGMTADAADQDSASRCG